MIPEPKEDEEINDNYSGQSLPAAKEEVVLIGEDEPLLEYSKESSLENELTPILEESKVSMQPVQVVKPKEKELPQ